MSTMDFNIIHHMPLIDIFGSQYTIHNIALSKFDVYNIRMNPR